MDPAPQDDSEIITQFKPRDGQWALNDHNINRIDSKSGENILHNYCKYIDTTPLEVYRYLIETKGCDYNLLDQDNYFTPIHFAFEFLESNDSGDINIIKYFLNLKDFNVNSKQRHGRTLLHTSCFPISKLPHDVFKLLIEAPGADINALDDRNDTPLHFAFRYFNPTQIGLQNLIYLLSQNSINVNEKDQDGYTMLHFIPIHIHRLPIELFKFLVETKGADFNVQDRNNNTPLHYLLHYYTSSCNISILTYLLNQKGTNLNIRGQYGRTLLHCIPDISQSGINIRSPLWYPLRLEARGLEAEVENTWCRTVETIIESYIQQILDETILS